MSKIEYLKLNDIFEKYYNLKKISSVLSWDNQVNMPKNGFFLRKNQQILLNNLSDDLIHNSKEIIDNCDISNLTALEKRNFYLMRNIVLHKTSIPKKLQQEFTKISLETEFIWPQAKENNNFNLFNKKFKKLISLLKEISLIKSETLNMTPYESLLDVYDPGRKEKDLDKLFAKLTKKIPILIDKAINKQRGYKEFLNNYNINKQKELGLEVIKYFQVSNDWCAVNKSNHPFCSGEPGDVRITTRYDKKDFSSSLMGLIHETGHALYDNNRPKDKIFQAIGQDGGMAIHESQSLFLEMQIARSNAFCQFIAPKICKKFNLNDNTCNAESLFNKLNHVERGYIRVDADELTYPLHISLRYEIEKKLIYSEIETDDLPDIWNEKLKSMLNLNAPKVSKGVLQDIHWSDGSLGYFPTYVIGAQFMLLKYQINYKIQYKIITSYW